MALSYIEELGRILKEKPKASIDSKEPDIKHNNDENECLNVKVETDSI